jgi:hypothetical protein
MGGKPRKKPLTFNDLSSAYDRLSLNWNPEKKIGEFWEVIRRLGLKEHSPHLWEEKDNV